MLFADSARVVETDQNQVFGYPQSYQWVEQRVMEGVG